MPKTPYLVKRGARWYFRIYRKGRQIEQGGYGSAEEASQARKKHLEFLWREEVPQGDLTLKDFVVRYLEDHERINNRYSTFIKAEGICRNHILPVFGKKKLGEITTLDLVKFQAHLVKEKTPAVAHNTMRIVRRVLKKAIEWGHIDHSPLRGALPPEPKTEHPTLPLARIRGIIEDLEGRDQAIVALLGLAGLRRSEVFGLQWGDIDFETETLAIRRQYTQGRLEPLKTDESRAVLPMCQDLQTVLKAWKLRCGSPWWILKGKVDAPLSGEWWASQIWPKIKKRFELPAGFRIHDLRHSFATVLLELGVPIENVQLLLRHRSLKTTAELYRHAIPLKLKKDISVLDTVRNREKHRENYR